MPIIGKPCILTKISPNGRDKRCFTLYRRCVGLFNSAFLKNGAKNLKRSINNCWKSTQPLQE